MIPITENTMTAVVALIYNHAYDQDPDTGWQAGDEHSAPGGDGTWLAWSKQLLQAIQELPTASDEEVLALAKQRMNATSTSISWNTIWMHQTEDGDEYSTITDETNVALPLVRDFLERPDKYREIRFLEDDPAYLAYLEEPFEKEAV